MSSAVLVDHVDVFADDNARPHALNVLGMSPEAVLRDVAAIAQLDRQGGAAEAGHGHRHAVGIQGGSIVKAVQALTLPQFLAGLRIKAPQKAVLVLGPGLAIVGVTQEELIL